MGKTIRLTLDQYQTVGTPLNIRWLEDTLPPNSQTPTRWQCLTCGYIWSQKYSHIRAGHGCRKCGRKRGAQQKRIPAAAYMVLATIKAIEWIGPEVTTSDDKTEWRCSAGHTYRTSYQRVKNSAFAGCKVCATQKHASALRLPISAYHDLATAANLFWLGPPVDSSKDKTEFECPQKHRFFSSYEILRAGHNCPVCAHNRSAFQKRLQPEQYRALGVRLGFRWLEVPVTGARAPTVWLCSYGHKFKCSYNNLSKGRGCPVCDNRVNGFYVSRQQCELQRILGGELNFRVGSYALDVALEIDDKKLCLEYDSWFWHQDKVDHDAKRDAYLIAHGWRILRVKAGVLLPTQEQLDAAIRRLLDGSTYEEITLADWREQDSA